MLDEKGITLSEISNKYPRSFQTLGYDVLMDVDEMGKPKIISTFEMCINTIITLLMMKPGQYPSLPELGIDIDSYLHEYSDDPTIPAAIKSKLDDQCNRLKVTGISYEVYIEKDTDGTNCLIVAVTGTDKLSYGSLGNNIIIGISYDKLNRLYAKKIYNK